MSFVNVYPTNLIKLSFVPLSFPVSDSASGIDFAKLITITPSHFHLKDSAKGIELREYNMYYLIKGIYVRIPKFRDIILPEDKNSLIDALDVILEECRKRLEE